ncbi:MAG: selenocysteine-specific translation elongation factor, partial [Planctomycetota bacterium]|nr:selenocysteine-specific translation elongation factor [Planctomycetota bacterium]
MDYVVISTAGHIDHGKTSLIKALTAGEVTRLAFATAKREGKKLNLDRLPEEKKREMTIDLGFSYLNLPSGRCAEIIDVPGHERFIKNMLAGVSAIDMALLVVDANESVMPQTREHFNILKLLGIKKGIIVITKIDLADDEQLQLVIEDIQQTFRGSFLEDAPIIKTSVVQEVGLTQLIQTIDRLSKDISPKDYTLPVRMPIDRVFTISGFGTVVTGTLASGILKVDDLIEMLPQNISSRVRSIESHSQKITQAKAGQRVGISLAGIKRPDLARGNCLVQPGYLVSSRLFDAKLNLLETCLRPIKNNMRVRLHLGSGEFLARIRLLDKELINQGESGFVQIRTESPLPLTKNDRFIIRFYTPMTTLGGGYVIDPLPVKHKQFQKGIADTLAIFEKANTPEMVEQILLNMPARLAFPTSLSLGEAGATAKREGIMSEEQLAKRTGLPLSSLKHTIDTLILQGTIFRSTQGHLLMHRQKLQELKDKIIGLLDDFHKNQPLRLNITIQEIRPKVISDAAAKKQPCPESRRPSGRESAFGGNVPQYEWFFNYALDELVKETKIQITLNSMGSSNIFPVPRPAGRGSPPKGAASRL